MARKIIEYSLRDGIFATLPPHLDERLTPMQREVLKHLAAADELREPSHTTWLNACRAAGYTTRKDGPLVRDMRVAMHLQRAREWLAGQRTAVDRRPMDRHEVLLTLSEIARTGDAREKLAAIEQIRKLQGMDGKMGAPVQANPLLSPPADEGGGTADGRSPSHVETLKPVKTIQPAKRQPVKRSSAVVVMVDDGAGDLT